MKTIKAQAYIPIAKSCFVVVYRLQPDYSYVADGCYTEEKEAIERVANTKVEYGVDDVYLIEFELPI